MSPETTITSQHVYRGRILSLRLDTVRLENGRTTEREIVEHRGAVGIVALDERDHVLLIRQFRQAVEGELLEIPAGTLEVNEEPLVCARRELEEETGYRAGHIEPLGGFYSSPGFCTEYMHLYLARELRPGHLAPAEDEVIASIKVPLAEAVGMIGRGQIRDAKSIVGLLLTWRRQEADVREQRSS